jgi:hypothetical protein
LGFLMGFRQLGLAPERTGAGAGADAQAILADAVEVDQALAAQHRHAPNHLLRQPIRVLRAEVRQRVVIHRHAAAQPLERIVARAESVQAVGAGDAFEGRIQPQRDQQANVDGRSSRMMLDGPVFGFQGGEVHLLDEVPDGADGMVGRDQLVEETRMRIELIAVGPAKTRPRGGLGRLVHGHSQECSRLHTPL